MLISIQFPMADSRGFLENTGRLKKPGWPIPTPDNEFVRGHGAIRIRPRGGLTGWLGENEICEAPRSVRLSECLRVRDAVGPTSIPLRVAFRRFFFDGLAVGKFELGLATKYRRDLTLDKPSIQALVDQFVRLNVRIRTADDYIKVPLARAAKHLTTAYLFATTQKQHTGKFESWWLRPGSPILFVECGYRDDVPVPYFARRVDLDPAVRLALWYCLVPADGGAFRMWFLHEYTKGSDVAARRKLRMYLLRLNAEHECLRLILRNMFTGALSVATQSSVSDALQHYLNQATRRIGLLEARSSRQYADEISEIARESTNLLNPGQRDVIEDILERYDVRKNIRRKVEQYSKQWDKVTVIEKVENNYMGDGDVFKDINQSIIATRGSIAEGVINLKGYGQEEIAQAISKLDELIAATSEDKLTLEKKKESAELLQGITEEASKQQPNKSALKAFGNTLLSILTSVEPLAKAGKTAFEVIKTLWS